MTCTAQPLRLPTPRGPLSAWTIDRLAGTSTSTPPPVHDEGLGEDLQLALYLAYESHYSTLPEVVVDREWEPALIGLRRMLETEFESALVARVGEVGDVGAIEQVGPSCAASICGAIVDLIAADDGPSLSTYMETEGTLDQMREFVVHRSAYQLKEGDPHTFAIPRVQGRAKQLLAGIQAGEYGADAPEREVHAALFARTMRGLGLDDRLHAHLDVLPASALAVPNLMSMFGLNRKWRGALIGHLTVFEMTSVIPMGRYSRALERLHAAPETRRFYDVHVLADAEHEVMALEMAGAMADQEPSIAPRIEFGARCVIEVERNFAEQLLTKWGRSAQRVDAAA